MVEIDLQGEFAFADGVKLDYQIADFDVDCKYSQRTGGWMIPNEVHDELCLVVTADDAKSKWSAGVVPTRDGGRDAIGVLPGMVSGALRFT